MEAIKFRPENIQPNQFMRPPTDSFRTELMGLSLAMERRINKKAEELAAAHPLEYRFQIDGDTDAQDLDQPPILRLGTELELLLFSPDSNPPIDVDRPKKVNPNYSSDHRNTVQSVANSVVDRRESDNLAVVLSREVTWSNIFMEIRTLPKNVSGYFEAIDRIREWFQTRGEGSFSPVVHSQHIHASLVSLGKGVNLFDLHKGYYHLLKGYIYETQADALPLLLLPEEIEEPKKRKIGPELGSLMSKGYDFDMQKDPSRMELRFNSSEYAFDPYINLLINLMAIYRGLHISGVDDIGDIGDIGADAVGTYPVFGREIMNWESELEKTSESPIMDYLMPKGLLKRVMRVIEEYRDISRGKRSLSSVRDQVAQMEAN